MARPKKIGMDYFPVDTTWDVKMQLIKAKYGLEGIGCIIELFKTIYHEGYYIKWDDDTRLLFASENKIDENKLAGIVGFAVQKGVFHAGKLDKLGILTSRGIQKRWLQVAKDSKRTTREIDKNIDLMKEIEFPAQETGFPAQIIQSKNVVSGTDNPHIILNDIILNKIIEDKKENIPKTEKHKYGSEENVLMTDAQYSKLVSDLGEPMAKACIEELSEAKAMKGYKYKRDDLAIRKWVIDAIKKKGGVPREARSEPVVGGALPEMLELARRHSNEIAAREIGEKNER